MKKTTEIDDKLGHRQRLKTKFDENGADSLADYELLELILFQSIPRIDTKPLAKQLMRKFKTLGGVMGASKQQLMEIKGLGKNTARDIKVTHAMIARAIKTKIENKKTILENWSNVINYCTSKMAHLKIEQFRVLFLNLHGSLIKDEVQQEGTIDTTPVYPREIIKRALALNASSLVLVHNHPSGNHKPSITDIGMTQKIIEAAKHFDIEIEDHIIISKTGHSSMKALDLI